MCGIVGVIDNIGGISQGLITVMRDVMTIRGPDGSGEFIEFPIAIAMRRLAVIDLQQGWQPLMSAEGQVIVFQNGEIYNFRALRKELERYGFVFMTNSDTEVLAHGFLKWGIEGLLQRIDGMYAIAIMDKRSGVLHLARDRFGEKPLFYCDAKGKFGFASDMRSLAALPWVGDAIDPSGVERYLALHYVPGDRTILNDVRRLLPGERIEVAVHDPVPVRHRYYVPPVGGGGRVSDGRLAAQVEEAVRSRLVADVPVGVFLSGGLDSSIVAAIAASYVSQIDTFSIGFQSKEHDESPYAKSVAEHLGSTHHHFIFDESKFVELLPQVVAALDEPIGDQAMLPLFWLCREARKYVTVALSGEGADEIFGGYAYYAQFTNRIRLLDRLFALRRHKVEAGFNRIIQNPAPVTPSGFPLLTDQADREYLTGRSVPEMDEWESGVIEWLNRSSDPLQRASCADIATWLPDDLLVKFDRMAMANSLEGRAPYLQPDLAAMGLCRLAADDRLSNGVSKVALRRIARRWLPDRILKRPKQGFVLPMSAWIAQWLSANGGAEEYFNDKPVPGTMTGRVIEMVNADLHHGLRRERLLFALLMLAEWHHSFKRQVREIRNHYESTIKVL